MSGQIVGKVLHHGPQDQRAYAVAVVIAEDMHDDSDTALLSIPELMRLTRLGRTSVVAGIRILREDGWVRHFPGGGQGVASRYQLRVAEKLSTCTDTCRHTTGIGSTKPVATRQVTDSYVSPDDQYVSPRDPSTVTVNPSVPATAQKPTQQASLLLPFEGGRDDQLDDYAQTVLADVPATSWPRDRAGVAQVLGAARAAGWSAERLRDDLAAERHDYGRIRGGAVLMALTRLAQRPAPRPPWQPCGECINGWIEDPDTGVPTQKCACHPSYGVTPQPAATTSSDEDQPRTLTALERVAARAAAPQYDAFRRRRHG